MHLELVRTLATMRAIYALPAGPDRFRAYLAAMTGDDREGKLRLPLSLFNPLGKEAARDRIDALIALDAEAVVHDALCQIERDLATPPAPFRVALVLADDAGGGWTNRDLSDMKLRFEHPYARRHGWVEVVLWTGDATDGDLLRRTVRAAVRRRITQHTRGAPRTLEAMLAQEGDALSFAGEQQRYTDAERLSIAQTIAPHRTSRSFGTAFAALYGDDSARSCGFAPLGIPPHGGFDLALAEAPS